MRWLIMKLILGSGLAILAGKVVYAVGRNLWDRYQYRNLPSLPNYPLIGSGGLFVNSLKWSGKNVHFDLFDKLLAISRKYENEPFFIIWDGLRPNVVLHHPTPTASLLNSPKHLAKGFTVGGEWIGDGMVLNEGGARWKYMRRLFTPCFHKPVMSTFPPIIHRHVHAMIDRIAETEDIFNFSKLTMKFVFGAFLETQIGLDLEAMVEVPDDAIDNFIEALHILISLTGMKDFNPLERVPIISRLTWIGREERKQLPRFQALPHVLIDVKIRQMHRRASQPPSDSEPAKYILDKLLEEYLKGKIPMKWVKEEMYAFIPAGMDTSAGVLTWTMFCLCVHQEIQTKLRQEITKQFAHLVRPDRVMNMDELDSLPYLDAVFKEAMRIYPVVPLLDRCDKHPLELDLGNGQSRRFPQETLLSVLTIGLHRNRTIWGPDADLFDPERFLSQNRDPRRNYSHCFLPFGAGPRNCIGRKYGIMVMKYFLVHLIANYKFTSQQDSQTIKPNVSTLMHPVDGLWVKAIKIT